MSRNTTLLTGLGVTVGLVLGITALNGRGGLGRTTPADEKGATAGEKAPKREADEKAIRMAAQELARAFEKGDAKAAAAFWTEEGEYVEDEGKPVRGRAALAKAYTSFFAKRPQVKVEIKTTAVRFLGKDTALEEGTFTARAKNAPVEASRYSSMWVRQDGRWLIALLKEWNDEDLSPLSLRDLAWLIGTWEGAGADSSVQVNYRWDENKAFILARYSLKEKKDNKVIGSGTQVIGYDAAENVIRGWTFDAQGGFGEAVWTWADGRWTIDSAGTMADGSTTTAMNLLTPAGADAFTWRSVQRTRDDVSLPDLAPLKVTRVKEKK